MKRLLSAWLTLILLTTLAPIVSSAAEETYTVMVYLCGTDLESEGGLATDDLKEMVAAGLLDGGHVNVYVQTGGTKKWTTNGMTNRKGERWLVSQNGIARTEKLGNVDMGDGDTLSDFLQYGLEHYPADHYAAVLWNHGGGAGAGVCYDEVTQNYLDMSEVYAAFTKAAGSANYRTFDFVGFDACLMADYELALHLAPFADYMIASEETEPGEGWVYTDWLARIAKEPSVETATLGRVIVDGFLMAVNGASYGEFGTLSVVDLRQMTALQSAVERMGASLSQAMADGDFNAISRIRQNLYAFGDNDDAGSDMVDLTVFANAYGAYNPQAAQDILTALGDAVVVNGYTSNLSDISGLSILVPYSTRSYASDYLPVYDTQNLTPRYADFINAFVENVQSGSYSFGSASVQQESLWDAAIDWFSQYSDDSDSYYGSYDSYCDATDDSDYSLDDFLNDCFSGGSTTYNDASDLWSGWSANDSEANVNSSSFGNLWGDQPQSSTINVATDEGEQTLTNPFANASGDYAYTVSLSEQDMQYLSYAEATLMMDVSDPDFECYVDLGYTRDVKIDSVNGKLYGLFDGTWPTLDGQMVCIYDQICNESYIRSLIPVTVNGSETYLLVVFDADHPSGVVVGYSEGYTVEGYPVRGYTALQEGDVVIPQYELLYWDENDEQQIEPFEGDAITVGSDATIPFGYDAVETDVDYAYGFCLNDVFGEYEFTDFITLEY